MLPTITNLSYTVHLPIANIDAKVYAYTIRENKLLMMAKDSPEDIEETIIEILKNKVPDVNVEELTYVDIIVLFIALMHISKGTHQTLWYKCLNVVDDKECGTEYSIGVDLMNFYVKGKSENHKLVRVTDNISVEFMYPTYNTIKRLIPYVKEVSDEEYAVRLCSYCIETIYNGEEPLTDIRPEEIYDWILNFPPSFLEQFDFFLMTMPTIGLKWNAICPKCGANSEKEIVNLIDFFMQASTETK